jgi:PPOX class probable FMN-dependent enzyme
MSIELSKVLQSEADLRVVYKQPTATSVAKTHPRLDRHARRFIELSPFLCMGSSGSGLGDVTPRGGEPGFVHVLDETCLAIPDRPGNNRLDALNNIIRNPAVGLLFFIPGFEDTLRVNGTARICIDEPLKQRFVTQDKPPLSVIVVQVLEVYFHCAKALRRSALWEPGSQVPRSAFPTMGEVYREQLQLGHAATEIDAALEKNAREHLY